jgi:hypothetical protein
MNISLIGLIKQVSAMLNQRLPVDALTLKESRRRTREGARIIAPVAARISRLEGMEGHALTSDVHLAENFPEDKFDLGSMPPVSTTAEESS